MSDTTTTSYTPPPLADGETYIGLIGNHQGEVYHLILLPGNSNPDCWEAQLEWAKSIGGDLPNRVEQIVLWELLGDKFKGAWYWINEPYNHDSHGAWHPDFSDSTRIYVLNNNEFRARAVRRVYVKDAGMSDTEWHSSPPPSIGWWPTKVWPPDSIERIRWWDGKRWSYPAIQRDADGGNLDMLATWPSPIDNSSILWSPRPSNWLPRSFT